MGTASDLSQEELLTYAGVLSLIFTTLQMSTITSTKASVPLYQF